jgi:hypothetical protein
LSAGDGLPKEGLQQRQFRCCVENGWPGRGGSGWFLPGEKNKGHCNMDDDVNRVISPDIGAAKRIVNGKGEVGQHSLLDGAHCGNELEFFPGNVALGDKIIIEDLGVIKGERRVKRIGIKKKDDCREKNRTNILFRKMFLCWAWNKLLLINQWM